MPSFNDSDLVQKMSHDVGGGGSAGGGSGNGNLVTLPDGSRHLFPLGTTQDQMQKALNLGPPKPDQPNMWDRAVDMARPFVSTAGGLAGAAGTALIPGIGETGVAELAGETQGYAVVDSLMKYLKTQKPTSFSEALTDSEKDAALNAVAGRLVSGVWRGAKAWMGSEGLPAIYKLAPTTSQALESYGRNFLAKSSEFLENFGATASKAKALDRAGGEGFTQALEYANHLNGRTAPINGDPVRLFDAIKSKLMGGLSADIEEPGTALRDVQEKTGLVPKLHSVTEEALGMLEGGGDRVYEPLDKVLQNTDSLAKVLKVGQVAGSPSMNVKKDLAAYQFMKLVNDATVKDAKGLGARIDPKQLMAAWNDEGMQTNYQRLFGKDGMQRISDFFRDIAYTQTNNLPNNYLKYAGRGNFLLGAGLFTKAALAGSVGGMVPGGLMLGASAVGKLLTNETTARIVTEAAQGALTTHSPTWAMQMIGAGLKGVSLKLMGIDGTAKDGTFIEDENGHLKFEPYK